MRVRTSRVPVGYRELEYIESSGTQYIDSGVNLSSNNFKVECDFINTINDYNREQAIFSIWTQAYQYWNVFIDYSKRMDLYTSGHTYGDIVALKTKYNLSLTRNSTTWTLKLGDNVVTKTYSPSSINTTTLKIFTRGDTPTTSYSNTYIQMFYLKVTVGEILVRNFIPCERQSDNKPGLYDVVNNVFYTNQGTGEFIKGPYKDSYKISLYPRLPLAYQEVEYIESSGTQYIDSGIKLNQNSKVEITYQYADNNTFARLFGDSNGTMGFIITTQTGRVNSKVQTLYNTEWRPLATDVASVIPSTNKVTLKKELNNIYVNNNLYYSYNSATFETGRNALVFGAWTTSLSLCNARIYALKIWQDGITITRDFIPCYRKSDSVIGLYDLVNQQFYTNAGTGTFTKGNDVNNIISCQVRGGDSEVFYNYNQKLPISAFSTTTLNQVTITNNNDGSYTLNGTANQTTTTSSLALTNIPLGHTWLFGFTTDSITGVYLREVNSGNQTQTLSKFVRNNYNYLNFAIRISEGTSLTNKIVKPIVIDLTDWFGSGNEPATVEDFKAKFNKDYYGYCPTAIKLTQMQINAEPTYGYNQLIQNGNFINGTTNWNSSGCLISVNNNILTVRDNTNTNDAFAFTQNVVNPFILNHKYFISCKIKYTDNTNFRIVRTRYPNIINLTETLTTDFVTYSGIGEVTSSSNLSIFGIQFLKYGVTLTTSSYDFKDIVYVDLTEWFGSGNEPSTVQEFRQRFYKDYYPYSTKRILNQYIINELIN